MSDADNSLYMKLGSMQAQVNTCVKNDNKQDVEIKDVSDRVRLIERAKAKVEGGSQVAWIVACAVASVLFFILGKIL